MPRVCLRWAIVVLAVSVGGPSARLLAQVSVGPHRGLNIGGWLDEQGYRGSSHGEAPSDSTLECLRSIGFDAIRLPIDGRRFLSQQTADATAADAAVAVASLLRHGFFVLMDLHPPPKFVQRVVEDDAETLRYESAVRRSSEILGDLPRDRVALELLNEPHGAISSRAWEAKVERFIAVARGKFAGPIVVSGLKLGTEDGLAELGPIRGKNVVYSVHYYQPFQFTFQGAPFGWPGRKLMHDVPFPPDSGPSGWVEGSVSPGGDLRTASAARRALLSYERSGWTTERVSKNLDRAAAEGKRLGAPVWLGEFGTQSRAPVVDRARWMRAVRAAAEKEGMPWFVWQLNGTFSIRGSSHLVRERVAQALGIGEICPRGAQPVSAVRDHDF